MPAVQDEMERGGRSAAARKARRLQSGGGRSGERHGQTRDGACEERTCSGALTHDCPPGE
ncbi:hypothetical protein TNCT6_71660 [Streptomyces sp. 6-11-2]|nr:hypothetical protein TNCT6_71660 [Streptomyces sp. 6-11-2]